MEETCQSRSHRRSNQVKRLSRRASRRVIRVANRITSRRVSRGVSRVASRTTTRITSKRRDLQRGQLWVVTRTKESNNKAGAALHIARHDQRQRQQIENKKV